jgi:hypothetical protein
LNQLHTNIPLAHWHTHHNYYTKAYKGLLLEFEDQAFLENVTQKWWSSLNANKNKTAQNLLISSEKLGISSPKQKNSQKCQKQKSQKLSKEAPQCNTFKQNVHKWQLEYSKFGFLNQNPPIKGSNYLNLLPRPS